MLVLYLNRQFNINYFLEHHKDADKIIERLRVSNDPRHIKILAEMGLDRKLCTEKRFNHENHK